MGLSNCLVLVQQTDLGFVGISNERFVVLYGVI